MTLILIYHSYSLVVNRSLLKTNKQTNKQTNKNKQTNRKQQQTNLRGIGIRRDVLRRHSFVVEAVAKYF